MDRDDPIQITQLLREWQGGRQEAFDRLVPMVHGELRTLASRQLSREWRHDRLQITAIVNEAYPATIKREWAIAKGWLFRELTGSRPGEPA